MKTAKDAFHGNQSDRRRESRHDPGVGRRQPRRPRHRAQGRARCASSRSRPPSATATARCRSPTARKDARKLNKPEAGHFAKAGVEPGTRLVELRLDDVDGFESARRSRSTCSPHGERVDVTAVSRGKGFAGAMKRHNFKGQGASHGNHKHHRAPGSIGSCVVPRPGLQGH